ncbi:hypothetical protein MSAN_01731900 [Mycena sanguinolenta]|uniref:GATA-type domain-containing protein n=1 Tax=Mycena sanguinolenta TaxID=230812 RepID=A0A8H7CT95_9AGAR|nr:hypothetical protein MSAN_01731900 [Mycena sanguinolenta]
MVLGSSSTHSQEPPGDGGRAGRELALDPHSGLASSSDDAPATHSSSSSSIYSQNAEADGGRDASAFTQLGPINNADDVLARGATHGGEGTAPSHELRDFSGSLSDYDNAGLGYLDRGPGFRSTARFDGAADSEPASNADALAHQGIAADFGNAPDNGLRRRVRAHMQNYSTAFTPPSANATSFAPDSDYIGVSTSSMSITPFTGTRVAPRTRRRRRTHLERAREAVALLSPRDFNILFQDMSVLHYALAIATGLDTEPVPPSLPQTPTAPQGGPVGYGWHNSDYHHTAAVPGTTSTSSIASTSGAPFSPTSLVNSSCGPSHDPYQETHRRLQESRASTSLQDFVGASSNFPQHHSATSPVGPVYPPLYGSSQDSSVARKCKDCGTTQTPQWRTPLGYDQCNKCGHSDKFKNVPNKRKREHE